ncbi:MAG: DUF1735 domain-containing protein [Niabella sp.]|nr:DUF1735 domain-containing protein [Niabella sp.]
MLIRLKSFAILILAGLGVVSVVSCAKETFPDDGDTGILQVYDRLYLTDAFAADSVKKKLYISALPDTTFYYSISKGGTTPFTKDLDLTVAALAQADVDAYNVQNKTSYLLLPSESYSITAQAVLKAGESVTTRMPLTIHTQKLTPYTDYILPVSFAVTDTTAKVDLQKNRLYYIFRLVGFPQGELIGNIPALKDPGAILNDYYGDLMMRDASGNLWVYPLAANGNKTLGNPVKIYSGLTPDKVFGIWFSGFDRMVFLTGNLSGGWGVYRMNAAAAMADQAPVVTDPVRAITVPESWVRTSGDRWYMGPNPGVSVGLFTGTATNWSLNAYNGSGFTGGRVVRTDFGYDHRGQAVIRGIILSSHSWGLLAYRLGNPDMPANVALASVTKVGDGFLDKYIRMFSINQNDLICYKPNGDVIRYRNFNLEEFYKAM